jgi:hypothetical protein
MSNVGDMSDPAFHAARLWTPLGLSVGSVIGAVGATDLTSGWVTALWATAAAFLAIAAIEPIRWALARRKRPEATQQIIQTPTIESQTKVFSPTIVQADRPGWKAMCADGGSQQQPHGAVLYISSERETARDFRCLVRKDGGEPFNAHLQGGKVGRHAAHYPAAFEGAPPVSEGTYTFEWFGYVDESPNEMLLASGTFRVNNHLQVFCGDG